MLSLIVSVIALGAIVAFHEFGHFIVARLFGVGVIEFSIGMGPRLITVVRNNTRYSLRVLPFGGSCMMLGEEMDESAYGEDEDGDSGEDAGRDCDGETHGYGADGHAAGSDPDKAAMRHAAGAGPDKAAVNHAAWADPDKAAMSHAAGSDPDKAAMSHAAGVGPDKAAMSHAAGSDPDKAAMSHAAGTDPDKAVYRDCADSGTVLRGITNGTFDSERHETSGEDILVDGRRFKRCEQFVEKPAWQRFLIVAAGPFFNFVLAFLFAVIITAEYGYDRPVIMEVTEGTPLYDTGVRAGDRITGLAVLSDRTGPAVITGVDTARDIMLFMYEHSSDMQAQETFVMRYQDAESGLTEDAVAAPFYDEEAEVYRLGFSYSTAYAPADGIWDIIQYSLYDVKYCIKSAIMSIRLIAAGSVSNSDVMGPVRMVATMDEAVDEAADYGAIAAVMTLINLMILISGSLGSANLLPIPALDGGRLVFIIIEMLAGRPVPRELEGRVHMAGMLLLLGLMVLIMFNDVALLITG